MRDALRDEVVRVAPDRVLTLERLHAMKQLSTVLLEVKRVSPVIPGMFGRAKADIAVGGYTIPRGWTILFGLRESLVDGATFLEPERFEPARFTAPRCEDQEHEHALVPHGPGKAATSHHCAGTDYASLLSKVFAISLVRDHRIELPEQDLGYVWSQLTPDPRDGMRARVK